MEPANHAARRTAVSALLAASTALLALPAGSAAAAQATLHDTCKYPLVGNHAVDASVHFDCPGYWPDSVPTDPAAARVDVAASGLDDLFGGLDGATSVEGTATLFASVKTAQGFIVPTKSITQIATTAIGDPAPDPASSRTISSRRTARCGSRSKASRRSGRSRS